MAKAEGYKPIILVYGMDRVGYPVPKEDIETKLCVLHFEPFNTKEKFQDYEGVILFQGIFEEIEKQVPKFSTSYIIIKCYRDELQRRKKQYSLLREKKGFVCFLLIEPFVERDEYGDKSDTDLAKWALNYRSFFRKNIGKQITLLRVVRNEFIGFLKHFGAAWTTFSCYNDAIDLKGICKYDMESTGIILWNKEYFIPTLKPKEYETDEFFKMLADSLISSYKKLSGEIPDWVNEYKFEEEKQLIEKKNKLQEETNKIDQKLMQFREYKKCVCYGNELLRESIIKVFRDGFNFKIDDTDKFKEDFKIVNSEGKSLVLVEVKGTNKGIKREYINQTDSHRERAGLYEKFPSILIINTNIKKSNSLKDKYQQIAREQIKHAVRMNVLVMRTIDLLNVLYLKKKEKLKREDFLDILRHKSGWLEASQRSWNLRKE